ncbi:expansin-A4 isoform X2 [Physcomitrium patens]|nr:expansin-A4-like [Physcomitrium patens]PNR51134.1 hypothetical protein PHYPA_010320 [Physcomitrium patens]|eukprot:XP_024381464.1 expansin-A4-like [Physcomitrella patens]
MSGLTRVEVTFVMFVATLVIPSVLGMPVGWRDAHITYYGSPNGGGTQGGACAYQNTFSLGYGAMTAALSSPLFEGGAACGACYQLQCKRVQETRTVKNWCWSYSRTITITATNLCPPGSAGAWCDPPRHHFDLTMPAFLTLARREGGVAPVLYRRVKCVKRGGIRFTIGGNPWFLMILIHNVAGAGDVRAVRIKTPSTDWIPMYRNWGALWTVQRKLSGPLSFQITAGDRRQITINSAVGNAWKFGQTWEGHNFR